MYNIQCILYILNIHFLFPPHHKVAFKAKTPTNKDVLAVIASSISELTKRFLKPYTSFKVFQRSWAYTNTYIFFIKYIMLLQLNLLF